MTNRKKISTSTQSEVLVQSRRRCCICFGLHRDDSIKKGQIAHLDGDASNNNIDNLSFLCLDHHDEYDGKTSQSKGLTTEESKKYREELYAHFNSWNFGKNRECLLNFLVSTIDLDMMADAALKAACSTTIYGESLAYEVLVARQKISCDGDIYIPYLMALDQYASWGWLTYEEEERKDEYGYDEMHINVKLDPICRKVADVIKKRILDRDDEHPHWLKHIDKMQVDEQKSDR